MIRKALAFAAALLQSVAMASITCPCLLPTAVPMTYTAANAPSPAAAAGYNTNTFTSTTFSTTNVDTAEACVNNFTTGGSNCAYQWFPYRLDGANPLTGNGSGGSCLPNLTFSSGNLVLNGCTTGPNGQIVTAVPNVNGLGGQSASSTNYRGTAFGGGMYVELTAQMPSGFWTGGTGWPAFWFQSLEGSLIYLNASNPAQWAGQASNYLHLLENDSMEMDGGTSAHQIGSALHEAYGIYGSTCTAYCQNSTLIGPWNTTGWVSTQTHKYGMLYIPATGSTSGSITDYLDGTVEATQSWTQFQNTGVSPFIPSNMPANGTNGATSPTWLYGVQDTYHYVIILGTGPGAIPFKILAVNVWQANSSGNVSN